jgi:hypothetical protein
MREKRLHTYVFERFMVVAEDYFWAWDMLDKAGIATTKEEMDAATHSCRSGTLDEGIYILGGAIG